MQLKIVPLGGLGEIGMNCLYLEINNEAIVIDCGLMFTDLTHFGVDFVVPDFSFLVKNKKKIKGFLITHGHEDHIGSLPYALREGVDVPIYASPFTSQLIKNKLKNNGLENTVEIKTYHIGETLLFNNFKVSTVPVTHSIIESAAFIIETPLGTVIHTGDFNIDERPFNQTPMDLTPFNEAGDKGVFLLMSDSTNAEVFQQGIFENEVYLSLKKECLESNDGLTLVTLFSSNIKRIEQLLTIGKEIDKKIVLIGRSLNEYILAAKSCGYLKGFDSILIDQSEIPQYERNKLLILITGSQAESRAALTKAANGDLKDFQLKQGDRVLFSSKFIPGNEKAISHLINKIFKLGAHVVYGKEKKIHSSGHATRPELLRMIKAVRPKFFVPVHGEYRHLVRHSEIAQEAGVAKKNIKVIKNSDVLEVSESGYKLFEPIAESRDLKDDISKMSVTKTMLKRRRKLAEAGFALSFLIRDKHSKEILFGPDVRLFGVVDEPSEPQFLEGLYSWLDDALLDFEESKKRKTIEKLSEFMRIEVRRFLTQELNGKRPVVIPFVFEI